MSDARLRELEKQWHESGADEDRDRYEEELVRTGALTRDLLEELRFGRKVEATVLMICKRADLLTPIQYAVAHDAVASRAVQGRRPRGVSYLQARQSGRTVSMLLRSLAYLHLGRPVQLIGQSASHCMALSDQLLRLATKAGLEIDWEKVSALSASATGPRTVASEPTIVMADHAAGAGIHDWMDEPLEPWEPPPPAIFEERSPAIRFEQGPGLTGPDCSWVGCEESATRLYQSTPYCTRHHENLEHYNAPGATGV